MRAWLVLGCFGLGCTSIESVAPDLEDSKGPTRIIVVGMDTVRRDEMGVHGQSLGATPHLDRIAASSVVFENAWAPAPRTRPSFRSATTGRWPLQARFSPNLGMLLKALDYRTAGFVANVQLSKELGFARGFDTWKLDNMADANVQVDAALAWLDGHQNDNTMVFLHLMDPHIFYRAPEPFLDQFTHPQDRQGMPDRYNRKDVLKQQRRGLLSAEQKRWIRGRHMGEVAFMDQEIGRFVKAVDRLPGQTWVIFHSDHGEEFWDHGGFEHNHTLHDELLRAILWIRPPGGVKGTLINGPVSLVDIVPTVLGLLGVPDNTWPTFDGFDLSPLLFGSSDELEKSLEVRPLQIGHMMYSPEQWGVILGDEKYVLTTGTGQVEWTKAGVPQEGSSVELEGALSQATGWPILQGWRLKFTNLVNPLILKSGREFGWVEIIDPEDLKAGRANIEWGEIPDHQPDDVASLVVSDDRKRLEIRPGRAPSGVVFIQGDSKATITSCNNEVVVVASTTSLCGNDIEWSRGAFLREDGEAYRPLKTIDPSTTEALQSLGYLD